MTRDRSTGTRHLIGPIRGPIAVADLQQELQEAHDYLATAARKILAGLGGKELAAWGATAKRQRVLFDDMKPSRLSERVREHNFAEVMNQCATLERLLDAMAWAESALPSYGVQCCNPTTSSSKEKNDHDLVLVNSDGALAKFEVSDVISRTSDSNKKETKDLRSLEVLTADNKDVEVWPLARIFLVVSPEFAERLLKGKRHGVGRGIFHYCENVIAERETRILEVIRGMRTTS